MRSLATATLVAVAFLATASSTAAQATFALKGGLNTAFFSGDDAEESSPRLGFVGGGSARYPINPLLSVQAEVLYSQKGDKFDNDLGFTETTKLDYIEIPGMLRLGVPLSPLLDAGVVAGGYVGVPVRSEVEIDGELETDLRAATDYGALVGFDIGSGPVYVEGRYTFGLTDAIDFDPGLAFEPDFRNQVASFTIGYRFGGRRYARY